MRRWRRRWGTGAWSARGHAGGVRPATTAGVAAPCRWSDGQRVYPRGPEWEDAWQNEAVLLRAGGGGHGAVTVQCTSPGTPCGAGHVGLTHTETQRGRLWTA